jgi:(heptosyl)LPS beta-1,4-glucosyltransferase
MKKTLSVVISAYNEELPIKRCLSSVQFADEIIVVDNESVDNTVSSAKKFTNNIYTKSNQLMLNINKNFGFTKAKSDWILNLDADEEITPDLAKEIQSVIQSDRLENGYWIKRKNFSFGKWIQHGLWWPDKQIRLFRRNKGEFPCYHIHEYIKVDGLVGELKNPYNHYNYESIHQYLTKIDRASSSEAISLKEIHYQLAWFDALRFPISDFIKIFFAQHGYKDGLHGLMLALFQSFYSFSVFAKVWETEHFPDRNIPTYEIVSEVTKRGKEIKYWMISMKIDEAKSVFAKVRGKIERKFT